MLYFNSNGSLLKEDELLYDFHSASTNFTTRVYEIVPLSELSEQNLEPYYFNVMAFMRVYRMPIPISYTLEFFVEQIQQVFEQNRVSLDDYFIKWEVVLIGQESHFFLSLKQKPQIKYIEEPADGFDLFKDAYWNAGFVSGIPSVTPSVFSLATGFCNDHQLSDVAIINERKELVHTLKGFLFLRFGEVLKTPSEQTGVYRLQARTAFLDAIAKQGAYVLEQSVMTPFELQRADECFIYRPEGVLVGVQGYRKKRYALEAVQSLRVLV